MRDMTLKMRLRKRRPVTSITLRIPVDVVDSLKSIAPNKGFSGYQTLLKAYISEGLRRDEVAFAPDAFGRLARALKKHGVSKKVLDDAMRDLASMALRTNLKTVAQLARKQSLDMMAAQRGAGPRQRETEALALEAQRWARERARKRRAATK